MTAALEVMAGIAAINSDGAVILGNGSAMGDGLDFEILASYFHLGIKNWGGFEPNLSSAQIRLKPAPNDSRLSFSGVHCTYC